MEILGTIIDNHTREEILKRVETFLSKPMFHQIATVNPEFLLEAEKNRAFQNVLNQCDLRIADGFGITLAFLFKGEKLRCRFPGADLMEAMLHIANEKKMSVYLAINKNGLSSFEEIKNVLSKEYPNLILSGTDIDSVQRVNESALTYDMHHTKYDILLCNFGAPRQEIFLQSFKKKDTVRLAMGIGGSFDYLTRKRKRAPKWLRTIGMEWLWRFILQPKRWVRIWKAVVVFPFHVFFATIEERRKNL